jgi:glutamate/tyrosine decarboxylase-like PLP-dependent enzyme
MSLPDDAAAEFRQVGHRLVDVLADYLDGIEQLDVFPNASPVELEKLFAEPLPRAGVPLAEVVAELEEKLLPNCTHVGHPGYLGFITPSPLPAGGLADLLGSVLNQNPGAWAIGPGAVAMERRVVRWLCDLVGYDGAAGGNLTSGGMMANFIGLKLARDAVSGDRAQHEGVRAGWAVYTSDERHVAVDKAVDALGLGRESLRVVPTDDAFRIELAALEEAIEGDRAAGVRPLCLVAMGGSTNTGAADPLGELRRIADREGAWLHVDAAYGAGMLLAPEGRDVLAGLERADSVAVDPHKWFFAPVDAGAILVQDASQLTRSFGMEPAYLADELDEAGERYQYFVHGFEQSRRFRALKVWTIFKRYGTEAIGRFVEANVEQARRLYDLAEADPEFEGAVRPSMSAVCVGYRGAGLDEDTLGRLHAEVVRRVEQSGRFWITTTRLKGRPWFRVNPVNFRTRLEHMDQLFGFLRAECGRVAGQLRRHSRT